MPFPKLFAGSFRSARKPRAVGRRRRRLVIEHMELRRLLAGDIGLHEGLVTAEGEGDPFYIGLNQRLAFHSFAQADGPTAARLHVADPSAAPTAGVPLNVAGSTSPLLGQSPDWTPDGSMLVFSHAATSELWIVDAFTGKLLPVLERSGEPVTGRTPVWVGDLNRTLSWAGDAVDPQTNQTNWDIFYCGIDLYEDKAELAHVPLNATRHPAADLNPTWSSSGSYLYFESDRAGLSDIFVMDFYSQQGTTLPTAQNLTANRDTAGDFNPELSPDGTQLVFVSSSGNSDIWVMNVDGSNQRQVTNQPTVDLAPTWSPDGKTIAYASFTAVHNDLTDPEIYTIGVDGTNLTQITDNDLFDGAPTWRGEAIPPSDLTITVTGDPFQREDHEFEVVVTARNLGIATAKDVTLKVDVGYGIEIEDAVAPQGTTMTLKDNYAILKISQMAVGSPLRFPLELRPFRTGAHYISATVYAANDADPHPSNNGDYLYVEAVPENDNFADAHRISGAVGNVEASNALATRESSILGKAEPAHAIVAGSPVPGGSSIWYRWSAPDDGIVTFNTKGSDFDTLLAGYYATNVEPFELVRVASSDDAAGRTSEIKFQASKNADYYIAVDGYKGASGSVLLNWSQKADIKPAPRPQHIQSLSTSSVLKNRGDLELKLHGDGFSGLSRVYVFEPGDRVANEFLRSANFLQTTFSNDSAKLEVSIPARFFTRAQDLRLVAMRGNLLSNVATLRVSDQVTLPQGTELRLGKLRLSADSINQVQAEGEGESGVEVFELKGHVAFNDYLAVEGASVKVTIDRNANTLNVQVKQGRVLLTNLPGYGNVGLWSGGDFEFTVDGEGELTRLLRAQVETPLRDKGLDITIDRARLLLGTQRDAQNRPIFGIEIDGSLKFNQVFGLVGVPIQFSRLSMTQNQGLKFGTEIGPLNFGVPNLFGVEGAKLSFIPGATPDQDVFRGEAWVVLGNVGLRAKGAVEIQAGRINSASGELEVGVGFPLGPINITGGNMGVENLLQLSRLKVFVGADMTILVPAVSNVLRLNNAQIYYQLPASFGGSASLQIFKVDAAAAHLDIDLPNAQYTFGGEVTLVPSFPIFVVRGELTAGFRENGSAYVSGYAEGVVQIPDGNNGVYDILKACGVVPVLNIRIGPCLQFPIEIASAKLSYKDNAFSFSTDLPIVGKTSLRIKQTQQTVTAAVELFSNFSQFRTEFKFGGSGEGELGYSLIGDLVVAANTPRLIVSAAGQSSKPDYDLIAPDGTRITAANASLFGAIYFYNEETHDSIYVIENPQAGTWRAEALPGVSDVVSLEAWGVNAAPELNNLQASLAGDGSYDITYTVSDVDDDAQVSLYYTTSPEDTNGKLIADGLLESSTSSFRWTPADGSVPSGTYYIYALADDGHNAPVELFTAEPITVADPLAPATPAGLILTAGTENTILVQWDANTESDLAGYQISYAPENIANVEEQRVDVGTSTSFTLKGLMSGQAYRVTVVAYDRTSETTPDDPAQQVIRHRFSLPTEAKTAEAGMATFPNTYFGFMEETKFISGNDYPLTWTVLSNDVESQQLFVSRDRGNSYQLVADLDANERSFVWRASAADAQVPGLRFQLVVYDTSGNSVTETTEDFAVLSAGVIEFGETALTVNEGQPFASLLVRRVGGLAGRVTAQFATRSDSATADSDYASRLGVIAFEDGETEQTLLIPIIDDAHVESTESFEVVLRYAEGGALLGAGTQALVQITSEDVVTDTDGDGILDSLENLAPGGDGNADGTADALQAHVGSLFASGSAQGLTVVAPAGTSLSGVQWVPQANVPTLPAFLAMHGGVFEYTMSGVTSGDKVTVQLIPHGGPAADTYIRVIQSNWAWLPGNAFSGVVTEAQRILMTVTEGHADDLDATRNTQLRLVGALGQSQHLHPHQNALNNLDVNGDRFVSPIDALLIINDLNVSGSRGLQSPAVPRGPEIAFIDTSGDGFISPIDALLVINLLNTSGQGEGEAESTSDHLPITSVDSSEPAQALLQADPAGLGMAAPLSPSKPWDTEDRQRPQSHTVGVRTQFAIAGTHAIMSAEPWRYASSDLAVALEAAQPSSADAPLSEELLQELVDDRLRIRNQGAL